MSIPGGAVPGGAVPAGAGGAGASSLSTRPFGFGVAYSYSTRPFNFGAARSYSTRPFGLQGPPVSSYSRRPFALQGPARSTSVRPFTLTGPAASLSRRPFALLGGPATGWGGYAPGTPGWGQTYVVAAAAIGATTIYVSNGAGFRPGQALQIGTLNTTVVTAVGGTITIADPLVVALSVGGIIRYALPVVIAPPPTTISVDAPAGSTTVTVTTAGAYQPGQPINIGGEVNVVASVSGSVITLLNPLVYGHLAGAVVTTQSWGFLPSLNVYTKQGVLIGNMAGITVTSPPSRELMNIGAAQFYIPIKLPGAALVDDDRLVVLQTQEGEEPWAGAMTVQSTSGGRLTVSVDDIMTTLAGGPKLELKREVPDNTNAASIYAEAIGLYNANAAANGEVIWELDAQTTRPFRGDLDFEGDALQLIAQVARRSGTEFIWSVRVEGSTIVPTLVCRDRFQSAGITVHDTANDPTTNIVDGSIRVTRDPTPIAHTVRLRGTPTELSRCLAPWAVWAGHDVTPEVEVSVPAGTHRTRAVEEIVVDWGLSHAMVTELCKLTEDTLYAMYFDFLKAIHDIEGRPYHPGYLYAGPTDYFETPESGADALSRRTWRTRRQLVETFPDTPAAAVMISDSHTLVNRAQWLIINYNRVTGVQSIQYWGFPAVAGASMTRWHVDDGSTFTLYYATGGRIYDRATPTVTAGSTAGTGSFVESYNTRLYDPVTGTYRNLRRILSGGYAFNGDLIGFLDPADPDVALTDLGTGAGIDLDTLGELIGKVYDFEVYGIETWDPRRDGVGEYLSRETIFNGVLTTKPRWHIVPWTVVEGANTTIVSGISATETQVEMTSVLVLPQADQVPFRMRLDEGLNGEIVLVTAMQGTLLTIERGQDGTTAVVHEAGASSTIVGGEVWDGFVFPYTWPEGEQYAQELLDRLSQARMLLNFRLVLKRVPTSQVPIGALLDIDITSEGIYSGVARVIGTSPDPLSGETEVAVEYPYVEV